MARVKFFANAVAVNSTINTLALVVQTTDAMLIPAGNTGQRPVPGGNGYIRYNTDTGAFEIKISSGTWRNFRFTSDDLTITNFQWVSNVNFQGDRNTLKNSTFFIDYSNTTYPYIQFDTNDRIAYNTSSGALTFTINSNDYLIANSTSLEVNNQLVVNNDLKINNVPVTGKQAVWIPASDMIPINSSYTPLEVSTQVLPAIEFDASTVQWAEFEWVTPISYKAGNSSFSWKAFWSHPAATSYGVVWQMQVEKRILNSSTMGQTMSESSVPVNTITDSGGTTNDLFITTEGTITSNATQGNLLENEYQRFRVGRRANNASDTLNTVARLHGIILYIDTDDLTDG
jgi:hypothetical protein